MNNGCNKEGCRGCRDPTCIISISTAPPALEWVTCIFSVFCTKPTQHGHMITPVTALWGSTATAVGQGQSCWVIGQWQTERTIIHPEDSPGRQALLSQQGHWSFTDEQHWENLSLSCPTPYQPTSPQFLKLREMMAPVWTMAPDFKMPFQSHIFWGQAHQMAQGPGAWPARS